MLGGGTPLPVGLIDGKPRDTPELYNYFHIKTRTAFNYIYATIWRPRVAIAKYFKMYQTYLFIEDN